MSHWRLITNKSTTKTINDFNDHDTPENKPTYADWWGKDWELFFVEDAMTPEKQLELELLTKLSNYSLQLRNSLLPDYKLTNALLGIYSNEELAKFKKTCTDFRNEFYRIKSLIELAKTKAEKEDAFKKANFPKIMG